MTLTYDMTVWLLQVSFMREINIPSVDISAIKWYHKLQFLCIKFDLCTSFYSRVVCPDGTHHTDEQQSIYLILCQKVKVAGSQGAKTYFSWRRSSGRREFVLLSARSLVSGSVCRTHVSCLRCMLQSDKYICLLLLQTSYLRKHRTRCAWLLRTGLVYRAVRSEGS